MSSENNLIVSKSVGVVEFFRRKGITGRTVAWASERDCDDKDIYGVVPFQHAAAARTITLIDMEIPPERRGQYLSADEIQEFGGVLRTFKVEEV